MFTVLVALANHSRVTDIAQETGLPKSTVHRILQALLTWGFARTDGNGGYIPGPRILTLASRVMTRFDPVQQTADVLRDLRDRTGLTVHFAVRDGDEAVYVAKLEGARPYQMRSRVGMSIPLHSTAIGKAVLAQLPAREVDDIVGRVGLRRMTERSITDPAVLHAQLALSRERGYAVDDGENDGELRCLGAPVLDHTGAVMGGVSVSALSFELALDDPEMQRVVIDTGRAMSLALGAPPEAADRREIPGPA